MTNKKKFLKIILHIFVGIVASCLFAGLLVLFMIGLRFKNSDTTLATVPSPNGKFEAILMRDNPPAFSSYVYVLYVVGKNQKCDKDHINFFGNRFKNLPKIYWTDSKTLVIEYDSGHISNFNDSALFNDKNIEYDVRLKLIYNDHLQ